MASRRRNLTPLEVLEAVVRQAFELEDLTAHDVLEQIEALGRGNLVRKVREQVMLERGVAPWTESRKRR